MSSENSAKKYQLYLVIVAVIIVAALVVTVVAAVHNTRLRQQGYYGLNMPDVTVDPAETAGSYVGSGADISTVPGKSPTGLLNSTESAGERNARVQAQQVIDYLSFSEVQLYEGLQNAGYTDAEVKYAMSKVRVNWNEEAAEQATTFLQRQPLSRVRLIELLLASHFTPEQAEYAVRRNGY